MIGRKRRSSVGEDETSSAGAKRRSQSEPALGHASALPSGTADDQSETPSRIQGLPVSTMTNVELVVLALFDCGGASGRVDTEDVAIRASQLAPGRFSWKKHPQMVNLEHVRVRLSDAKRDAHGRLAGGSGAHGWRLTPAGLEWARQQRGVLAPGAGAPEHKKQDMETIHRRAAESVRIRELEAWQSQRRGVRPSRREAEAIFRISSYTPVERRRELIDKLKILFLDDAPLREFLEAMEAVVMKAAEMPHE